MNSKKLNTLILLSILAFSFFTHFIYLSYPSEVVFDEFYFGKFGSYYISKTPYFDIHPPLGKLMLGLSAKLFNISPTCNFEDIGARCDSYIFFALRFMPALFGVLTTLVLYFLVKTLTKSNKKGLLAAFLFSLSNIFLLQSRHIQIDIFLIFFGILAIYLFLKAKTTKHQLLYFLLSALSAGACISVKWTGISFVAFIGFLWLLELLEEKIKFKKFIFIAGIFACSILFIYLTQFYIHFLLIPGGGQVDLFLGQDFQELPFLEKISVINARMFTANTNMPHEHPYSSKFYQWPLMHKKILYWRTNDSKLQITSAGNPVLWFLSSTAMLLAFISIFYKRLRQEIYENERVFFFIIIGFVMGMLPYIVIKRATYVYHYFPSYLFSIINLTIFMFWIKKHKQVVFWLTIILIILGFITISPQTYGFKPLIPYIKP